MCGNGGSAADCQHFAAELAFRFETNRNPYAAVALTTDTSLLTAIGNDKGFHDVFDVQIKGLLKEGDVLVAFSTSGKSSNVNLAVKRATELGGFVISFIGRKIGSYLEDNSRIILSVPSDRTCIIQEVHQMAYHMICSEIDRRSNDR